MVNLKVLGSDVSLFQTKSIMVPDMNTASEILLMYIQEETFLAFHLISSFSRHSLSDLIAEHLLSSSQLSVWEQTIFESHMSCTETQTGSVQQPELENLCKKIILFNINKERTYSDGKDLLHFFLQQKCWELNEEERIFCTRGLKRLSELHGWKESVETQNQSKNLNFFFQTYMDSFSMKEI
jgi:hypothetical protein